jgi:hypothetical protein
MICGCCGEEIKKIRKNYFVSNSLIFGQYCPNISDRNGEVLVYGKLHTPIKKDILIEYLILGTKKEIK